MGKVGRSTLRNTLWLATCILSASLAFQARAEDSSSAVRALLARARTLAAHGHLEIAVQTWQQVLLSEANNLEALRGIADADMQLGRKKEAQIYLDRLKRAGGSETEVNRIAEMQDLAPQQDRLAQAGKLARAGQYAQAMQIYREIFGANPPAGDWALAYYDTEAATESGRAHAVAGLRKLVDQFPAEDRYAITLGRILTYTPATRSEGISILRRYQSISSADDALKQALAWEAQAARSERDMEAQRGGAGHEPSAADNPAYGAAYRALNSGDLSAAEQKFQSVLSHDGQDGRALAGMGYVRMKQQEFSDAAQYFEQAIAAGNHDRSVSESLATSRFWSDIQKAGTLLKGGDADSAIAIYQQALTIRPDSPEGMEGLGGAYLRAGRPSRAVALFEREVEARAGEANAWRGLLLAQSQSGQVQEAIATAERIPSPVREQLEKDPDFLSTLASDYASAGDQATADRIVKRALSMPLPDGAENLPISKQMQYASLLMMARRYNAAARLYSAVVTTDPENSDAWRALVSVHHQLGQDTAALRDVQHMPEGVMQRSMQDSSFLVLLASVYQSQHRFDEAKQSLERAIASRENPPIALQVQLASISLAQGEGERAYSLYQHALQADPGSIEAWRGLLGALHRLGRDREALEQVGSIPEDLRHRLDLDPGYLETLAAIRSALGQTQQAYQSYARIEALYARQRTQIPADTLLGEGWVLLEAGDNDRLYSTISRLAAEPRLTETQQKQLQQLWVTWSIRRAQALAKAGDLRHSLPILQAAARAFPGDPAVNGALAGIFLERGAAKEALALYTTLDMTHATAAQYEAAVGAALAAHDRRQAEGWLQSALDRYSHDPRILQLAAQFEQDQGDPHKAALYYAAALRAMGPQTQAELIADNSAVSDLEGRSTLRDPREQLLQMLNPGGVPAVSSHELANPEEDGSGWRSDEVLADIPNSPALVREDPNTSDNDSLPASTGREIASPAAEDAWPIQPQATGDVQSGSRTEPQKRSDGTPRHLKTPQQSSAEEDKGAAPLRVRPAAMLLPGAPLRLFGQLKNSRVAVEDSRPAANAGWQSDGAGMAYASTDISGSKDGEEETPLPLLTGSSRSAAMIRPQTQRERIQDKLAALESASSGWMGGTSSVDYHSGQPGYDQLIIFSNQVEQSSMIGGGARATIVANPVLLDNGTANSQAIYTQGTLSAGTVPGLQTAAGIGGELQLRTRSMGAALGYTPRGFLISNVTGRFLVQPDAGPVAFTFERQPIVDSQLSYAGLRDLGSRSSSYIGNTWGGVISNAAELHIARGDGNSGWYIQGGGQYITGTHVETNRRLDGDAGSYWAIWNQPEYGTLTLGANFFGMHYAHNLRYFTYGQGGYFSPGAYLLGNVPVSFAGHSGNNFHYNVTGSLGVQAFQEDAAPYYPLDPAIQAAARNAYYQEQSSVGGNYDLKGAAAYAISDHWYVGALVSMNNSRDYNNDQVGFFVRYMFHKQAPDGEIGPTGIVPIDGIRPLQLP
jgi:tetratricopeptide (TPR) repeat protein